MSQKPFRADGSGQAKAKKSVLGENLSASHAVIPKSERSGVGTMDGDYSETPEQRMGRFRRLAAKARESAAKSSSPVERDEFLRIANSWEAMATTIMRDVEEYRR